MKNLTRSLAGVFISSVLWAGNAWADDRGVPPMSSDFVRNATISALEAAQCRIVKIDPRLGVWGGDAAHRKARGGRSCHNSRRAIDLFPDHLSCDDSSIKGMDKVAHVLRHIPALKAPFLTVCGPEGGPCNKRHSYSGHIGAREALRCKTPW